MAPAIKKWWQDFVEGRLRTPQDIRRAALNDSPDPAQSYMRVVNDLPSDDGWHAPKRLQAPNFILSDAHARQWGKADYQQTDPRLMLWGAIYTELARKRGIPLYVHCAFRDEAEQNSVNHVGNSKARYPRSPHNIGEALDVVHGVYHWTMTQQEWSLLHLLGLRALDLLNARLKKPEQIGLVWGGSWSFYDPAHWEISDYRARIKRLPVLDSVHLTPRAILGRINV